MSASLFLFSVLVPVTAIICTFVYFMKRLQVKSVTAQREHDASLKSTLEEFESRLADREAAIERLEERIRVLERIVTDGSAALRDEIDRLRA